MKLLISFIFILSTTVSYSKTKIEKYQKIIPSTQSVKTHQIPDPISDDPVNTTILEAFDKKNKRIGFIREIKTTTGCNSGCLPVIFTLYFDPQGKFIDLSSKPGLTKKNHVPFTEADYLKLKEIILKNPKSFQKIGHPYELVDMVSGATKKSFQRDVVSLAAYTSLRVNLYYQQTLKELAKILLN